MEASISSFFYIQIVSVTKATVSNWKQMQTRSLKRIKAAQNVTQIFFPLNSYWNTLD